MTKILTDKSRPDVSTQDDDVFYPESDGEPMGETGIHVLSILELMAAIQMVRIFMKRKDIHVAGDMFLYYEKGNPKANKSPDVMVTFGIDGTDPRRTFKTWVEGTAPHVIFEITSDSTWKIDVYEKPILYASLGDEEYYIFDPVDECLNPRFQGFELVDGAYRPMSIEPDGSIVSPRLESRMIPEDYRLRLIHLRNHFKIPFMDEMLPTINDMNRQLDESEKERLKANRRARQEAKRAEEEAKRAEEEAKRAEEEAKRAEEEARRVKALEAEVARLRSLLENQANPDA